MREHAAARLAIGLQRSSKAPVRHEARISSCGIAAKVRGTSMHRSLLASSHGDENVAGGSRSQRTVPSRQRAHALCERHVSRASPVDAVLRVVPPCGRSASPPSASAKHPEHAADQPGRSMSSERHVVRLNAAVHRAALSRARATSTPESGAPASDLLSDTTNWSSCKSTKLTRCARGPCVHVSIASSSVSTPSTQNNNGWFADRSRRLRIRSDTSTCNPPRPLRPDRTPRLSRDRRTRFHTCRSAVVGLGDRASKPRRRPGRSTTSSEPIQAKNRGAHAFTFSMGYTRASRHGHPRPLPSALRHRTRRHGHHRSRGGARGCRRRAGGRAEADAPGRSRPPPCRHVHARGAPRDAAQSRERRARVRVRRARRRALHRDGVRRRRDARALANRARREGRARSARRGDVRRSRRCATGCTRRTSFATCPVRRSASCIATYVRTTRCSRITAK